MRFTSQTSRHHLETLSQLDPDPVDPYKSAVQSERRYLSEATMKLITNPTHQPEEVAKPAAPTA